VTTICDIALPQLKVLDSSMAYREAGSSGDPVALFSTQESNLVAHLAKYNAAGCTGGALHRAGSHRIRPVGKTS
jgi:hypothetical protein